MGRWPHIISWRPAIWWERCTFYTFSLHPLLNFHFSAACETQETIVAVEFVKLVAISVLVHNNFVELWLKPWCLRRWARFPWGKRLIKAQEMEDLFCIKYLEKGRSLNPLVITKFQGMVSLLLNSSIKMTCSLIWHTSPFRSGLPHFVRVVYIISSNLFYFPLPENSFQNANSLCES